MSMPVANITTGVGGYHAPLTTGAATPWHGNDATTNPLAYLLSSDKEIIYRATGQLVHAATISPPALAVIIGTDRMHGLLSSGQLVSMIYLKDLARRFVRGDARGSLGSQLDKALRYLTTFDVAEHVDVTA